MRLVIELDFGNDAKFYSQVRSVIAEGLYTGDDEPAVGDGGSLRDVNGNRVGSWRVESAPRVSPAQVPHAYKENDLGTDGCAVCGKARVWRNHTAVANDR